jgi:hypothetical protein
VFKERSTFDIVVILLTITVGATLVSSVAGVFWLKIYHPDLDTSHAADTVRSVLQTIVGALVGFIGGKAAGRMEANGGK